VVELHVPAGTHAVDVNQNLGSKHEFSDAKEVLLDRDLTFTVSHRPDGTAILTKKDARALGGSGSGFFGHAGRPGEVGGSSSGEVGAPTDALKKLTEGKGLTSGLSRLSPSEIEAVKSWLKDQRPTDVPVYRGIWLTTQQWEDSNFWRVGRTDGYALKEVDAPQNALSSWTRDSSRASAYGTGGDVFVTFKLPSGLAVDISSHSVYPVEKEALLPEKLDTAVVKAEMTSPGSWTLDLVDKRGRALGSLGNPVVLYHYDVEDLR
jgi:hypothetical protein